VYGDAAFITGQFRQRSSPTACIRRTRTARRQTSSAPGARRDAHPLSLSTEAAPLAVEAGPVIFGDPGTRFTESIDLLLETIARLRTHRS
jgi:hypothetical protein